jgi:hypothetical protein
MADDPRTLLPPLFERELVLRAPFDPLSFLAVPFPPTTAGKAEVLGFADRLLSSAAYLGDDRTVARILNALFWYLGGDMTTVKWIFDDSWKFKSLPKFPVLGRALLRQHRQWVARWGDPLPLDVLHTLAFCRCGGLVTVQGAVKHGCWELVERVTRGTGVARGTDEDLAVAAAYGAMAPEELREQQLQLDE